MKHTCLERKMMMKWGKNCGNQMNCGNKLEKRLEKEIKEEIKKRLRLVKKKKLWKQNTQTNK